MGARHAHGGLGRLIDILAIFATLFGSAASRLGLGALQIGSGFHELNWKGEDRHRAARPDHRRY
nr:BCCT family transporter [Streptomyces sp. NBC_00995]